MNLNNKCYFNVEHKFPASKLNGSKHLRVTTGLKAGGFSCSCGCQQVTTPLETVVTNKITELTST